MQDNIQQWAGLLVRSKPLQEVFADFTDRVARILDDEMSESKQLITDYLNYPRPGKCGQTYYIPKNEILGKKALNVFAQAKSHVKAIETEFKVKEI